MRNSRFWSYRREGVILLLLVLGLSGCSVMGTPGLGTEGSLRRIDLNGTWKFSPAAVKAAIQFDPALDDSDWPGIRVPANWYLQGWDFNGAAWYRRHFTVPRELKGKFIRLRFNGIDYAADVWLNGIYLGFHEGYFQPFEFNVTTIVKPGEDNLLAVRVDSPYEEPGSAWSLRKRLIKGIFNHHDTRPGGAWSFRGQEKNTGGIWNDVELLVSDTVAIRDMKITPFLPGQNGAALAEVQARIEHSGVREIPCKLEFLLVPENFDGPPLRVVQSVRLPPGESERRFFLEVPSARLWWPVGHGLPNLYRLTLTVHKGTDTLDSRSEVFGFRSVGFDPDSGIWTINGKRLFLRGTNYIPTQWLGEMNRDKYIRDADLMLNANINVVRVHAHVGDEEFYRVCDEKGLLIWQDFPLQWGYTDAPDLHAAARRQAGEMVEMLYNHPAVVTWSMHNEPPWDAFWMKYKYPDYDPEQNRALDDELYQVVLSADPTRYVHKISATAEHLWLGWYSGHWLDFAKPTRQKLVAEYGAQALPGLPSLRKIFSEAELWPDTPKEWEKWEYHNFQRKETFENAKVPMGANIQEFIANTQAYQSRLIQLAAESYRRQKYRPVGSIFQFMFVENWPSINWGVLDYWRQPKLGYEALKIAYQPILPSIEWTTQEFRAGDSVHFGLWAINDRWETYPEARLIYVVTGDQGEVAPPRSVVFTLAPDSSRKIADAEYRRLPPGTYTLTARIETREGRELGQNRFVFKVIGPSARRDKA